MNAEDVEKAIEAFGVESISYKYPGAEFELTINGEAHTAKMVDHNDAEDEYSQRVWFVLEVDGRHFIRYGMYRSHWGFEWDYGEFSEVAPVHEVVKVYRPI